MGRGESRERVAGLRDSRPHYVRKQDPRLFNRVYSKKTLHCSLLIAIDPSLAPCSPFLQADSLTLSCRLPSTETTFHKTTFDLFPYFIRISGTTVRIITVYRNMVDHYSTALLQATPLRQTPLLPPLPSISLSSLLAPNPFHTSQAASFAKTLP